ncbi:CRISPR-associated helicase Cas3' [Alcaligenes sp. SDU_A2]|uniref:CRISPR-associated helicase Cas3' n=1 Tax=Alcaligenes sp. SDU_A2 TaxID=3136634 RepID=UPI00311D8FE2
MSEEKKLYHLYWGKLDRKTGDSREVEFHPLAYHCLDVAAVAYCFLRNRRTMTRDMADFLGLDQEDFLRLIVILVMLHDLGKFASAFQGLNSRADPRLWSGQSPYPYDAQTAHHDRLGLCFWNYLKEDFLSWCWDWDELTPREKNKATNFLSILMECSLGHHGRPVDTMNIEILEKKYTHAHDISAARAFLNDIAQIDHILPTTLSASVLTDKSLKDRARQLSWPLAGIVVLADWLGSNREFFPYQSSALSLPQYWEQALGKAEKALQQAELDAVPAVSAFRSIEHHFRFAPSPLQDWAQTVDVDGGPQLFILEDVTGAGKTEAALALTHRLLQAGAADGFYFGLPTMATSNAMFNRVADYYLQMLRQPDGSVPSIVLAHGARDMHPAFRQAVHEQEREDGAYASADDTATIRCNQWLGDSRKKALLAPVGVGTIDQALLAALPRKHQSLRLLGLSRKVLVFDEIHAADAYMFELLESLLTMHVHQGGSAVLLTATLPLAQRQRLVNIWLNAMQTEPYSLRNQAFPLATSVNMFRGERVQEHTLASRAGSERRVDVQFLQSVDTCLDVVVDAVEQGRCVVWVRNTVAEAIEAYRAVRGQVRHPARCQLFHSRFVMADRQRIETEVLQHFGKSAGASQRAGRVLITTQVFQESLDADADVMISDLCLIDDLIQRAGRLHRHARDTQGNRQAPGQADARGTPILWVHAPPWQDEPLHDWLKKADFGGTQAVYRSPGRLWLGMRKLRELGGWSLPEQARELIEAVYGEQADDAIPESLRQEEQRVEGKDRSMAASARSNALKWEQGYSMQGRQNWYEDELDISTRYSDVDVANVVLLRHSEYGLVPWVQDDRFAWELSTVRLPQKRYASRLPPLSDAEQSHWDALTQQHRKLQFLHPWVVDQDGTIAYDAELGVYEKIPAEAGNGR